MDDRTIKRSMSIDLRGGLIAALLNNSSFDRDSFFLPVLPAMRPGPILDIDTISASGHSLNVACRMENIEATTLQIVGSIWLRLDGDQQDNPCIGALTSAVFSFLGDMERTREDLLR